MPLSLGINNAHGVSVTENPVPATQPHNGLLKDRTLVLEPSSFCPGTRPASVKSLPAHMENTTKTSLHSVTPLAFVFLHPGTSTNNFVGRIYPPMRDQFRTTAYPKLTGRHPYTSTTQKEIKTYLIFQEISWVGLAHQTSIHQHFLSCPLS